MCRSLSSSNSCCLLDRFLFFSSKDEDVAKSAFVSIPPAANSSTSSSICARCCWQLQHLVPVLRVAGHHLRRHLSYLRNNCQGPLLYLCLAQPDLLLGTKVRSDTILMTKPSYPEVDKCFEIPVHFFLDGVNQCVHRGIKT